MAAYLQGRLRRTLYFMVGAASLLIVLGLAAYLWTDRAYSDLVEATALNDALVVDLHTAALAEVLHTRAFLISGDPASLTNRALAAEDFETAYQALNQRPGLSTAAVQYLDELKALHADYEQLAAELIELSRSGQQAASLALFNERSDPLVMHLLETRRTLRTEMLTAALAASRAFSRQTALLVVLLTFGFGLVAAAGVWRLQSAVARPLAALEYLEQALVETAEGPSPRPVRLPHSLVREGYHLLAAYNTLTERLAANASARVEFVARLAHDLRSPLGTIGGYAALLEAQPASDVSPAAYARIINGQTQRVSRLLEQMVLMAQLEDDPLRALPAPLQLGSFLRLLVEELAGLYGRPLHLEDLAPGSVVSADAGLLRELFLNLVDNAVKYSPAASAIQVRIAPDPRGPYVQVQIIDQGPGIAAADLAQLFRPFARLLSDPAHGPAGSGLGLYIARRIADRHGGTVELLSQLGVGTTACVSLPLTPAV